MASKETETQRLIRKARARAAAFGGVLVVLLAIRSHNHIRFDPAKVRFIVNGRSISLTAVRKQLDILEGKLARQMNAYAAKLQSREWSLDRWHSEMEQLIRDGHSIFGTLAAGTFTAAVVSPILLRKLERDLSYLGGFKRDIKRKRLSPQMIRARARSYLRSMRVTYMQLEQQLHIAAGFRYAKRVITAKESCKGCIRWEGKWVLIDRMPPIGTLNCLQFCRCYLIYKR